MVEKQQRILLAVVGLVTAAAILMWMRSSYQERRHEGDVVQARAVVQGQLEAFQQGDFQKAFDLAYSGLHLGMTITDFKKFVEEQYSHVEHSRAFRLGPARWQNGEVLVPVLITDGDGRPVPTECSVLRERDGWKVGPVNPGIEWGGKPPAPLLSGRVGTNWPSRRLKGKAPWIPGSGAMGPTSAGSSP